jgi:hypothetical protein
MDKGQEISPAPIIDCIGQGEIKLRDYTARQFCSPPVKGKEELSRKRI